MASQQLTYLVIIILFTYFSIAPAWSQQAISPVEFSLAIYVDGGEHKEQITRSLADFSKKNPGIKVKLLPYRGIDNYSKRVDTWLENQNGPSAFFWYGGSRIQHYSQQGLLLNLSDFWQKHQLDNSYPIPVLDAIKVNGQTYAIPITALLWTFYYNKTVFEQFNISVPTTWQETLTSCKLLRKNNIDLFSIGTEKSAWVTHAWFDYLNLRVHGLEFYRQLLQGKIAFTDERVKETFGYWKELIDHQCFNKQYEQSTIWKIFPRILRGYSAMTLIDGIPQYIHTPSIQNLATTSFPTIKANIPAYTVAPVNVIIIPAYVKLTPEFEKVLLHLNSLEFQSEFNQAIQRPPAHLGIINNTDMFTTAIAKTLQASPGGIQFLDREADINFAKHVPKILVEFMKTPDIEKTTAALEQLRIKTFIPVSPK